MAKISILALSLSLLLCHSGLAAIGGTEAFIPSSLFLSGPNSLCGAVLIAPRVILTAGHCAQVGSENLFKAGEVINVVSYDRRSYYENKQLFQIEIESVIVHESWLEATKKYRANPDQAADDETVTDLAMLVLKQNLPVQPATIGVAERPKRALLTGAGGCNRHLGGRTNEILRVGWVPLNEIPHLGLVAGTKDRLTGREISVCAGDSGSGVYEADNRGSPARPVRVIGLNSVLVRKAQSPLEMIPVKATRLDTPEVVAWVGGHIRSLEKKEGFATDVSLNLILDSFVGKSDILEKHSWAEVLSYLTNELKKDPQLSCLEPDNELFSQLSKHLLKSSDTQKYSVARDEFLSKHSACPYFPSPTHN